MSGHIPNDPVTILRQAQSFLSKGWCQWTLGQTTDGIDCSYSHPFATKVCAVGAILKACSGQVSCDQAMAILDSSLGNTFDTLQAWDRLVEWNNDPARTQDEVVTAFGLAAQMHERSAGFAAFRAASLSALQDLQK